MMLLLHMFLAALLVDIFYFLLPYLLSSLGYALSLLGWVVIFTILSLYAQSLPRSIAFEELAAFGASLFVIKLLANRKRRSKRTKPLDTAPGEPVKPNPAVVRGKGTDGRSLPRSGSGPGSGLGSAPDSGPGPAARSRDRASKDPGED
ncbi:MAG: hypothetical protein M3N08_02475 [Pseudomonadota bacterium]|nr:hypothetical protein [Pseudomonadota bacterium]